MPRLKPSIKIKHWRRGRPIVKRVDLAAAIQRINGNGSTSAGIADSPTTLPGLQTELINADSSPRTEPPLSKHYQNKTKLVDSWARMRDRLVKSLVEACVPYSFECVSCGQLKDRSICCNDCGPSFIECIECASNSHQHRPLHYREEWKDNKFVPFVPAAPPLLSHGHQITCCSSYTRQLLIFDQQGRQHNVLIKFCACEPEAVTLVHNKLWPAKAENPNTAYHLDFLKLLQILMLECQVSVKSFCEAMRLRNNMTVRQTGSLYRLLIDEAYEEFRHAHFQQGSLVHPIQKNLCPVCPPDKRIVSMDGNFGLVRKKSSGMSLEPPKHGDLLFIDSDVVKKSLPLVDDGTSKTRDGDCNQFQAGSKVRSRNKSAKLDVTGVFGSICRHEIPVRFLDMKHGERLAYPMLMSQEILNMLGDPNTSIHLLYDIACVFEKFLKKNKKGQDLLKRLTLAIPVFHCYGHQAKCQIEYNPRRLSGFANVDGEGIERLWSYLRLFAKITKEMTPSHRTDVLTDALIHFASKKIGNLAQWLVDRIQSAIKQIDVCSTEKISILRESNVVIGNHSIEQWQQQERQDIVKRNQQIMNRSWEEKYVYDLLLLDDCRHQQSGSEEIDAVNTAEKLNIEHRLVNAEKRNRLATRWQPHDEVYQHTLVLLEDSSRNRFLQRLLQLARERNFLLCLKKKYPDGQAVSERLSKQINKSCKKISQLVKTYNAQVFVRRPLDDRQVLDLQSPLYQDFTKEQKDPSLLAPSVRKQVLDFHFRQKRAEEEVEMCKKEMVTYCHHLVNHHTFLLTQLPPLAVDGSLYNKGLVASIWREISLTENVFVNCISMFRMHISLPQLNLVCENNNQCNETNVEEETCILSDSEESDSDEELI